MLRAAIRILLLGAVLGAALPELRAEDTSGTQSTLSGLPGVGFTVVTDFDDRNIEYQGLTALQLGTDVDMKLRMGRIPAVASEQEALGKGWPVLQVSVMARKARGTDGFAFAVYVELLQRVMLSGRAGSGELLAPTWSSAYAVGFARPNELRQIREIMKMEISKFVDAYQAANPGPAPAAAAAARPY
jgi:hypothetical protein